jgi:LAS superfamily LD-carboxypeptidase LdcB
MTELFGQTEQHLHYLSDNVAIHKDMLPAFTALASAAKLDGIEIKIASGFRSFERQLIIWNNKFSGKSPIKDNQGNTFDKNNLSEEELMHAILLFSALPGASRHHWGCDIDVYASNLLADDYQLQLEPWEYSAQGPLAKLSQWLNAHANEFGFYLPYASYQGGIAAEPWHLSYAPLAQNYQKNIDEKQLEELLFNSQLLGKHTIIRNLEVIIARYINNISDTPENCYIPKSV